MRFYKGISWRMKTLINDRIMWMAIIIGILFFRIVLTYNKEVEFVVFYDSYPDHTVMQLFYDTGNGYSEECSFSADVSDRTKIAISEKYGASIKKIRADFTNQKGQVRIRKIALQKRGITIKNMLPAEIISQIEGTGNLEYELDEKGILVLNADTNDGQVYFDDNFTDSVKSIFSVQFEEIILSAACIGILSFLCHYRKKIAQGLLSFLAGKKRAAAVLVFVLGVCWCYRDYLSGDKLFIFTGVADDSIAQTYPNLYRCAYLIENGKDLFGVDFTNELGAVRSIGSVSIFDWIVLFGTKNLPYLMGVSQVLKIIMSFVLFYVYLKLLNRREIVCYIGAASYALCGHMVMRQFWKSYSNEVVLSAFLLAALELSICRKKHGWLPIALLLYCITLGDYKSVLAFVLVLGYTVFRYLDCYEFNFKEFRRTVFYSVSAYILAVIGSFVWLLPSFIKSFTSERAGRAGLSIHSLFKETDWAGLRTAFIRTVSESLEGADKLFYDANILEGPTFYCGICMLFFLPFAFCRLNKKRKRIAGITAAIAMVYIIFPNLRLIINGFSNRTFKLSSFWIIILMLYYGTYGMDLLLSEKKANYTAWLLLLISFSDLFINTSLLGSAKTAVTQEILDNSYYDSSIAYIQASDQDDFYRIENKNANIRLCAGLVQDYYSIAGYNGGTSMNDDVHRFLKNMNVARYYPEVNHYITGLSNANELYSILGVKYVTTSNDGIDNDFGLEFETEIDGKKVYRNENVLPIGFCCDSYVKEEELQKLGIQERRQLLLDSCVLDTAVDFSNIAEKSADSYRFDPAGENILYEYDAEKKMVEFDEIAEDEVVVLEFCAVDAKNKYRRLYYGNAEKEIGFVYAGSEENESRQSFVFTGNRISYFLYEKGSMKNIKLTVYDKETYYKKAIESIQDRKDHGFQCSSFTSNHITGSIDADTDAVLYFSIPFDRGWNIFIDGRKAEVLKVNYGFIGAYLPEGNHDVVLEYRMPYLGVSVLISTAGIAAIIVWFIYWHKQGKRS